MVERNLCKEAGCPAFCCQNMHIFDLSAEERERCFPTAINARYEDFGVNSGIAVLEVEAVPD